MLRISLAWQGQEEVGLKVEGWLWGDEVALLEAEGERWRGQVERLVLDLEGLRFIDEAGAALLRRWSAKGVRWQGGSMFVKALLRDYGLE